MRRADLRRETLPILIFFVVISRGTLGPLVHDVSRITLIMYGRALCVHVCMCALMHGPLLSDTRPLYSPSFSGSLSLTSAAICSLSPLFSLSRITLFSVPRYSDCLFGSRLESAVR